MIQFDEHTYNPSNPVSRLFTGLYTPLHSACLHLGSCSCSSVAPKRFFEAVKYSWFEAPKCLEQRTFNLCQRRLYGVIRGGWFVSGDFFTGFYHGKSGSTIRTLLDGKINPKDWQVLSLGDAGFLQFFRVVSSDYGKPRIYKYTIRQALDSYSIQYIRVVDPMIGQRTTSQRSGGDLLLQPLVEPCGTYPCKAGIFTWIQTIRHGSDCSCGAGNEYFGYSNWLMVSCLIAVDELIALKQIRITLTKMWRHDTGTSEELNFSTLKEFSMRLRGWSLIQKRWRLEVLSFFRITLSTLEVPSRQTMPAQRLLPWWSRSVLGNENTTHFEGCLGSWK